MTRRLGITGGIGSGKSFVCSILEEEFRLPVFRCDLEARHLINTDPLIRRQLTALVGDSVYAPDGTLDKTALAGYLFASTRNATRVNSIVHPLVRLAFRQWCLRQSSGLVCMESAILYESGFSGEVDEVLFVSSPPGVRLFRAMRRDHASQAQIEARMSRQDTSLARGNARYVIHNDAATTRESIINQIKELNLC